MEKIIEIPPRITSDGDSGYFEELTKAVFRAGFSWRVVRNKWGNFRESFHGFDIETVAEYGSYHAYLRSLDRLDYYQRVKALTGQFRGLGRTSAFVFLACVNEETPSWAER